MVKDSCRDCGFNAYCRNSQCVCENGYLGYPPNCKPECVINSDCSQNLACINEKCVNPCVDNCGRNAECSVIRHKPLCTCPIPLTGNPYNYCFEIRSNAVTIILQSNFLNRTIDNIQIGKLHIIQ